MLLGLAFFGAASAAFAQEDGELEAARELEKGYRNHLQKNYKQAEWYFRRFLRKYPHSPDGNAALGLALLEQGKRKEAAKYLRVAIDETEDSPRLQKLAQELWDKGRTKLAAYAFRKLAAVDGSPQSYAALGQALLKLRDPDGALSAFETAKSLAPEEATELTSLVQQAEALRAASIGDFNAIERLQASVIDPAVQSLLKTLNRRMELAFKDTRIKLGTNPLFDSNAIVVSDRGCSPGGRRPSPASS